MMSPDTHERLAAIGSEVERACSLLVSPAPVNLDRCAEILEAAAGGLASIPPPEAAHAPEEARHLARRIQRAGALLEHAMQFHQGWRKLIGGMCGGYQADGSAAVLETRARLIAEA